MPLLAGSPDPSGSVSHRHAAHVEPIPATCKGANPHSYPQDECDTGARRTGRGPLDGLEPVSLALLGVRPLRALTADTWPGLLPAETRVAKLLALGATCAEIAGQLGNSIKTIDTHRANVLRKLGLRTTAALARHALRLGLVGVEESAYERGEPIQSAAAKRRRTR